MQAKDLAHDAHPYGAKGLPDQVRWYEDSCRQMAFLPVLRLVFDMEGLL